MRPLALGACAAVLAALAGCAGSSSSNPLLRHSVNGTLTCSSLMASGNTLAYDIQSLASANEAISGQWTQAEAATTGKNTTPTAAQDQAITDLDSTLSDLGTESLGPGRLAASLTALDHAGFNLTNGASGWQSAGPKVKADIATLDKACGSSSVVP